MCEDFSLNSIVVFEEDHLRQSLVLDRFGEPLILKKAPFKMGFDTRPKYGQTKNQLQEVESRGQPETC